MSKAKQPLTRLVATFGHELEFDKIPSQVVRAAKDHTLDALGVGLAAASLSLPQQVERVLPCLGSGEKSTILGFVQRVPPPSAALLNGMLIHSLEFDDTHIASVIHGSSVIVPAAMAPIEIPRVKASQEKTSSGPWSLGGSFWCVWAWLLRGCFKRVDSKQLPPAALLPQP